MSVFNFRAPLVVTGLIAIGLSNGCSCTKSDDSPSSPAIGSSETEWAIRVQLLRDGGDSRWVRLAPVAEVSAPGTTDASGAMTTKAVIDGEDASVITNQDPSSRVQSAWALVYGAAVQCGLRNGAPPGNTNVPPSTPLSGIPLVPPWTTYGSGDSAYYIFDHRPNSCDKVLAYEELLLCTADKLSEISDSLTPIHWDMTGAPELSGLEGSTSWTIPPQAEKDRFIARDLALNVLAQIPRTDALSFSTSLLTGSCARHLSRAVISDSYATINKELIFGPGSYPPPSVLTGSPTDATIHDAAKARMTFEAHVLRTSGRLMQSLVERSVYADMAGAEQRSARALDPKKGNQIAWGLADAQNGPYNSYAHAIRILAGRWEMGPNSPDPKCGNVSALNLLESAYGDDRSARDGDLPIQTAGQAYATQIVESSGIVVRASTLALPNATTLIREAVKGQLLGKAALSRGLADPSLLGTEKDAIERMVTDAKDGDLNFAMQRALRSYRLITNNSGVSAINPNLAGLAPSTFASPAVASAGGVVIDKGVELGRLPHDVLARAGGILEASQCNEHLGTAAALRADTNPDEYPSALDQWDRGPRWISQSIFDVGYALTRRIVVLRQEAVDASGLADSDLDRLARAALTESREWVGAARVHASVDTVAAPKALTVQILGFEPADYGSAVPKDAASGISLVYGPAWVAECAARLRDTCPADFAASYVKRPASVTVTTPGFTESGVNPPRRTIGFTGSMATLKFSLNPGTNANFRPKMVGSSTPNEHLYLIADVDPHSAKGQGMVLGTIALRTPVAGDATEVGTGFTISPMRRELLNAVLGIGSADGSPAVSPLLAAKSESYCIKGVPRDLFVPLESELTSDGDQFESSWKHYLALARQAAARADDLAQRMIDVGLQRDFRREGAGEQLADICGVPSALNDIGITPDGKPSAPAGDETLKQCLGEEKYDIVYLGTDPFLSAATRKVDLQTALGCKPAPAVSDGLCPRVAASVDGSDITTVGLGIAVTPKPETTGGCANMRAVADSLRGSGLNDTQAYFALKENWATRDKLAATAGNLRMTVGNDGSWKVVYAGEVVMDSTDQPAVWPGCLHKKTSASGIKCDMADPLVSMLNKVFRRCDGAVRDTALLGDGACESPTMPALGADVAELQALRWRVQNALWLLGSMTGRVHAGMFSMPLPAVDFAAAGSTGLEPELLTLYPPARFDKKSSAIDDYQLAAGATAVDDHLVGVTHNVAPPFGALTTASSSEQPTWLLDIYRHPERYKHTEPVENEEVAFDFFHLVNFFVSKGYGPPDPTVVDDGMIRALVDGMSGIRCADVVSPGSPGATWSDGDLKNAIGSIKTSALAPQTAAAPLIEFPAVTYGRQLDYFTVKTKPTGICPPSSQLPAGAFYYGYHDRKFPGLLFVDDTTAADGFSLRGSGRLDGSPSYVFSTVTCGWADVSHPVATAATTFPTAAELTPSRRLRSFAGSTAPASGCAATHQFVQALSLACIASDNRSASPSLNIEVKRQSDIPALRRWIASLSVDMRQRLGKIYFEGVPKRIVEDLRVDGLGSSTKKGVKGDKLKDVTVAIGTIKSSWNDVTENLDQIGNAVDKANLEIQAADLQEDEDLVRLSIERMNAVARIVAGVAELSSYKSLSGSAVAASLAGIAAATFELYKTGELEDIAAKKTDNKVALTMVLLRTETLSRTAQIQKSMIAVKSASELVSSSIEQISRLENKAKYESAKASGADYYVSSDGVPIPLPVNVVQRRQYDILSLRYAKALDDAKYLAFLARRAIEQRVGVPLDSIAVRVGALDAPSVWADDICRLQGVSYKKLREVDGDAGSETSYEQELADQYIGDYVTKLENFVEYYNAQFPSHDGDDTAILSLKDDLLAPPDTCYSDATNLLRYSGRLSTMCAATEEPPFDDGRWRPHVCDTAKGRCLAVNSGEALEAPATAPEGILGGTVSWLHEITPPVVDPLDTLAKPGLLAGPSGMISQKVHLQTGTYVLSWWDQARTIDGKIAGATAVPYRVGIYTSSFGVLALASPTPTVGTWSGRNQTSVTIAAEGDYYVSFGASSGAGAMGSVAIANVQLEAAPADGAPSAYVATGANRKVVSASCPKATSDTLRSAFERRCANGVCYYELIRPVVIDTGLLGTPTATAATKLAKGNFNYRHINLSLNVVGTGVRDCTSTPSADCFGSGFLEYTLEHQAERAGVLDWNGDVRFFKFGVGAIQHGKALTAERYMTMPLGSADSALISQPGIQKVELTGRPLDGAYNLRIWDSPALKWLRLDDIQIVLRYRYWSRVTRDGKGS